MTTDTRVYTSSEQAWRELNVMEASGWSVRQIHSFDHLDSVSQKWGTQFFVVYEKDLT